MVKRIAEVENRARKALELLKNRQEQVRAAYLFGSYAEGSADEWSDIDIAVFSDDADTWDFQKRVRILVDIQKEAGDDIELHFFPSRHLYTRDTASFTSYIVAHGLKIA